MEPQCETCQTPLGDQATTQLLCGHRYHTQCFLHNLEVSIAGEVAHELRCVGCHAHLFFVNEEEDNEYEEQDEVPYGPQQEHQQVVSERQRVHTLWDTDKTFQKDLKLYMKAQCDISQPRRAFQKLLTTKKRELNEVYKPIQLRLQGIYNTKKDELMNSTESKSYRRVLARSQRYYNVVRVKYNLQNTSFHYLREKRGCKRLHRFRRRWSSAPSWMIRRAIRFRFRY